MELLQRLPEIAEKQWKEREGHIKQESNQDFESLKATNATDDADIREQLTALESARNMMQERTEQSRREFVDLVGTWKKVGGHRQEGTAKFSVS